MQMRRDFGRRFQSVGTGLVISMRAVMEDLCLRGRLEQRVVWRGSSFMEKSRKLLRSYGYKLVVNNVAPDDWRAYEDWWVHPDLVNNDTIKEMTKIAHDNGALVLVDGAQHVPHHEVNVKNE